MIYKKYFKISFLTLIIILNILIIFSNKLSYSYGFYSWESGANGYELVYSDARENNKPLILYFHFEPSVWNTRMDEEYLANYLIELFLEDIPKVEINPDKGNAEQKLVSQYKIEAFPAFLVLLPSLNDEFDRIHPFAETDMSAEEFLDNLKETIANKYSLLAYSYFEEKKYDDALKYYEISSQYNPKSVYVYYAIGMVYNYLYHNKSKKPEFLKKAEENYKKALELDPEHEESKTELENLKK
ncbi:hypothetical protein ACFL6W_09200 [Thermodesulfobacteriota bacterium]